MITLSYEENYLWAYALYSNMFEVDFKEHLDDLNDHFDKKRQWEIEETKSGIKLKNLYYRSYLCGLTLRNE